MTETPAWKSPEHMALLDERQSLLDKLFPPNDIITDVEKERLEDIRSRLDDISEQAANIYLKSIGAF